MLGYSVAISGNVIAAGAYGDGSGHGAVYVFTDPDGDGNWANAPTSENVKIDSPGPDPSDRFGYSVDLDGHVLVVGAYQEDSGGSHPDNNDVAEAGAAYIFVDPNRDGDWTDYELAAYLKAPEPQSFDNFGFQVAIDGPTIAVSAMRATLSSHDPWSAGGVSDGGGVFVYTDPNLDGDWRDYDLSDFVTPSTASAGDRHGRSMALDGEWLVIGSDLEDSCTDQPDNNSCSAAGGAWLFRLTAADSPLKQP